MGLRPNMRGKTIDKHQLFRLNEIQTTVEPRENRGHFVLINETPLTHGTIDVARFLHNALDLTELLH